MGEAHGGRQEDRLPLARDLHPMLDVRARLPFGERAQVVAGRHPLGELAQLLARQESGELGLADQHDLEELLARRLEVRQQPDLLEYLRSQILGLVDDQHGSATAPVRVEQRVGQRVDEDLEAARSPRIGHPELIAHGGE